MTFWCLAKPFLIFYLKLWMGLEARGSEKYGKLFQETGDFFGICTDTMVK